MRSFATFMAVSAISWGMSAVAAFADGRPLMDFYGQFTGVGIADSGALETSDISHRDLAVVIEPADDGFKLTWTTYFVSSGENADVSLKEKSASLTFTPTDDKDRFDAVGTGDPLAGKPATWARIEGDSIIVNSVQVKPDGSYDLTSYIRTLTADGLDVTFIRFKDGNVTRRVRADLTRDN